MNEIFILICFGLILLSKMLNEKAYRLLSDDDKLKLMDGFSKSRAYSYLPLIIILGLFFVLNKYTSLARNIIFSIYFGLLLIYLVSMNLLTLKKMKKLELPEKYINKILLARAISYFGLGFLIFAVI